MYLPGLYVEAPVLVAGEGQATGLPRSRFRAPFRLDKFQAGVPEDGFIGFSSYLWLARLFLIISKAFKKILQDRTQSSSSCDLFGDLHVQLWHILFSFF